jgi:hypothetical protein
MFEQPMTTQRTKTDRKSLSRTAKALILRTPISGTIIARPWMSHNDQQRSHSARLGGYPVAFPQGHVCIQGNFPATAGIFFARHYDTIFRQSRDISPHKNIAILTKFTKSLLKNDFFNMAQALLNPR